MVTLKTLIAYEKLNKIVEKFLREKVTEFRNAEFERSAYSSSGAPAPIFKGFEIVDRDEYKSGSWVCVGKDIEISFGGLHNLDIDIYRIPLEPLFDDDFYEKMKAVFDEKRKKRSEKNRNEEKELYEKLKMKYEGESK